MQRLKRTLAQRWDASTRQGARSARSASLRYLNIEGLEDRVVPAAVSWVGGSGGIWELASNWSNDKIPTAADDVTINFGAAGVLQLTRSGDVANSITTNGNANLQIDNGGTLRIGGGSSAIGGGMDIVPGATVTFAAGATVGIDTNPISLQGTLTIGGNDVVTFTGGSTTMPNGIFDGGLLNVGSGASMITSGGYSPLAVEENFASGQGGRMIATNATFAMTSVGYDSGATLLAGDLTGNDFSGTTLGLDPLQVPLVTNNKAFATVDLYSYDYRTGNGGTLPSGTSLTLPLMGTASTADLLYDFVDDYSISAGATLTFAPGVKSVFDYITTNGLEGSTLTVDGLVNFSSGDSASLYTNSATGSPIGQIVIASGGRVNATNTSFGNVGGSAGTDIDVQGGSHLVGTGNTFGTSSVNFENGATLANANGDGADDLTGNNFLPTVVSIQATSVPAIVNNLQFGEVDLRGGTLGNGTTATSLELTAMGTESSANLFYVFAGNFTVAADATLILDPNLRINLYSPAYINSVFSNDGNTLTVDGTVIFGKTATGSIGTQGDLVTLFTEPPTTATPPLYFPTAQIVVNQGGVLNSTGTNFLDLPGSYTTEMTFNAGSYLSGTNNDFAPDAFSIADGVILNADPTQTTSTISALTGNVFANTLLTLPTLDVPLVTDNKQFSEVDLLPTPGGVPNGTNLAITAMGTTTASTLSYVLLGSPTINAGATVTFDPNLSISDSSDRFFGFFGDTGVVTDNGTLNFGQGDAITLGTVMVGSGSGGGVLQAPDATLSVFSLQVNSGGSFTTVGSTVSGALVFGAGSTDSLTLSSFTSSAFNPSSLTVDAKATETITSDNFTALGPNSVVATDTTTSPPPKNNTAQIKMTGNYWGSTSVTAIGAKIHDHLDDPTLPTIIFQPFINGTSAIEGANATATYGSAAQTVTLTASVIGVTGPITEGSVTFGVYQGTTLIGTPVTIPEVAGTTTASYLIPGGTPVGSYTIQVTYNGTANYLPSTDSSHVLTITQASATVAGPTTGVTAVYNGTIDQTVPLPALVSSTAGTVNEGTATFTVFTTGTTPTQVGAAVTTVVSAGSATGSYVLPAGTPGGTYTVSVMFDGSENYTASTASTYTLTVTAAPTTATATDAAATFSTATQTLTLAGSVSSVDGAVNEGALTFTVLSAAGTALGTPVTVNVANGAATATYTLPAGASVGSDTIEVSYNGTNNFAPATASAVLAVAQAATATAAVSSSATFSTAVQAVTLTADVASGGAPVNEGTVSFGIFDGSTLIGTIATGTVVNGVASASYTLPASLPVGSAYDIKAVFNGSGDYLASNGVDGTLTIIKANPTVGVAVFNVPNYSPAAQSVVVNSDVFNGAIPIGEGSVTFALFSGATQVGAAQTVNLQNGGAGATFTLPAGTQAGTILAFRATYNGSGNYNTGTAVGAVTLGQSTPTVSFPTPAAIVFGTPLTTTQLDATASVPGTFSYNPILNAVLPAGTGEILGVTFAPTDATDYTDATTTTTINVVQAAPSFSNLSASRSIGLGTASITVSGRIAAPTAIPVGEQVAIVASSGAQSVSGAATINANGTFTTTINTAALGVGSYSLRYSYAGDANFLPANDASTALTVTPAAQTITEFTVPTVSVYGSTFHVSVASSSGLPVVVTGTNAIVNVSPAGGYDVTPTSGTNNIVLTASQAGNGNYLPTSVSATVLATKANATVVILPNFGIIYDGQPHTVAATTNPPGLATSVVYTVNGIPVGTPTVPGSYLATASIVDPNYQGTALSALTIVPAVTNPTSPTNPFVGPIAVTSVALETTGKAKLVNSIDVTFSSDPTLAQTINLSNYRLAAPGTKGSYDAKNAKTYKIAAATYNPNTHTVHLRLAKTLKVSQALELRVSNLATGTENAIIRKNGSVQL